MPRVALTPTLEAVTVYDDRAQLTFSAPVRLDPSQSLVAVVENIERWGDVDWSTLQVRVGEATERAVAQAVRLQNICPVHDVVSEDVREDVTAHEKRIRQLEEEVSACEGEIEILKESCVHVDKIREFVSCVGHGVHTLAPEHVSHLHAYLKSPSTWAEMASFLAKRKATAQRGMAEQQMKLREVKEQLSEVQRRLLELGGSGGVRQHRKSAVEATLVVGDTVSPGATLQMELSCVVHGAGWTPLYDLRVRHDTSKLDLFYYANVRQCTSLDWEKVRLQLSTATPSTGASPPALWPRWSISTHAPRRNGPLLAKRALRGPGMAFTTCAFAVNTDSIHEPVAPAFERAVVTSGGSASSATVFAIPGLATVRHNNAEVKVMVAHQTFDAKLRYVAIPKLDPRVHLTATVVNTTDYEFIAGPSKVFYGNTFVNSSRLEHVSPGEEFEVALGTDETVRVSRSQVRRTESESSSLFSNNKSKLQFEYAFAAECGALPSDAPVTVVVKDNFPVSDDADVEVTLVQPGEDAGVVVDEDTHEVTWSFSMIQHAKINFNMIFTAKYPLKTEVFGLS